MKVSFEPIFEHWEWKYGNYETSASKCGTIEYENSKECYRKVSSFLKTDHYRTYIKTSYGAINAVTYSKHC